MRKISLKQLAQNIAGVSLAWGGTFLLLAAPASAQEGLTPTADISYQSTIQNTQQIYREAGTRLDQTVAKFASAPAASSCGGGGCNSCCDNGGLGLDLSFGQSCCLGDPWQLSDHVLNNSCCESVWNIGGWTQWGYHSESNGLYNNHDSRIQNHQSWLFLEKVAKGDDCNWDWGFRADIAYGLDAQDTQAFGSTNDSWDNDYDNGIYGWAMPQLYAEIAKGNLRIKAGKFFTMSGYEVVAATGNFFYSHAYTTYNSEPFTHTGALASYQVSDDLEVYGGWTAGWDTGFERFNNGSQFHGGFAYDVSCNTKFSYFLNAGSFGLREEGQQHGFIVDHKISDDLNYVFQSDILDTNGGDDHSVGINQYLLYSVSDCLSYGTRAEWWKFDGRSQYAWTVGLNYKPHANIILRPELRHDWNPSGTRFNADNKDNFTTVAMDAILTF